MAEPHPDDDALLAVAEGTAADAAHAAHVGGCARCADLVRAYRAASATLAAASVPARAWCPPRESLFLFAAEDAPVPGPLLAHVSACPACREDVRDLRALALDPDALPAAAAAPAAARGGVVDAVRARVVLALDAIARGLRLLESTLPPGPVPVPVVARGAPPAASGPAAPIVVVAPFGAGELELTWVAAHAGVDLRARARGGAPRAYRVALSFVYQGSPDTPETEELCESRSADEEGQVSLAGLEPARYVLAVFGPQRRDPDLLLEVDLRSR